MRGLLGAFDWSSSKVRGERISIHAAIHICNGRGKRKEGRTGEWRRDGACTYLASGLAGQLEVPSLSAPPSSESRSIGASCEPESDLGVDVDGAEEPDQSRLKELTRDIYSNVS
jgi:hypothetical protein